MGSLLNVIAQGVDPYKGQLEAQQAQIQQQQAAAISAGAKIDQ